MTAFHDEEDAAALVYLRIQNPRISMEAQTKNRDRR